MLRVLIVTQFDDARIKLLDPCLDQSGGVSGKPIFGYKGELFPPLMYIIYFQTCYLILDIVLCDFTFCIKYFQNQMGLV